MEFTACARILNHRATLKMLGAAVETAEVVGSRMHRDRGCQR